LALVRGEPDFENAVLARQHYGLMELGTNCRIVPAARILGSGKRHWPNQCGPTCNSTHGYHAHEPNSPQPVADRMFASSPHESAPFCEMLNPVRDPRFKISKNETKFN
jgi:hypothetical protein